MSNINPTTCNISPVGLLLRQTRINKHLFKTTTSITACTYIKQYFSGSVVVDFLFIVTPIVGVCNCSMFCCTLLYVHFSIAIILMGKRELIALLNLSSWCLVMVKRLFLAVPRGCLQFVIVVFPDHTHLLFFIGDKSTMYKIYSASVKSYQYFNFDILENI